MYPQPQPYPQAAPSVVGLHWPSLLLGLVAVLLTGVSLIGAILVLQAMHALNTKTDVVSDAVQLGVRGGLIGTLCGILGFPLGIAATAWGAVMRSAMSVRLGVAALCMFALSVLLWVFGFAVA